jgi:hypothetical protein
MPKCVSAWRATSPTCRCLQPLPSDACSIRWSAVGWPWVGRWLVRWSAGSLLTGGPQAAVFQGSAEPAVSTGVGTLSRVACRLRLGGLSAVGAAPPRPWDGIATLGNPLQRSARLQRPIHFGGQGRGNATITGSGRAGYRVDFFEAIAVDDVDKDDSRLVVTLLVPCDGARIGDPLEVQLAHGGDHIGSHR